MFISFSIYQTLTFLNHKHKPHRKLRTKQSLEEGYCH